MSILTDRWKVRARFEELEATYGVVSDMQRREELLAIAERALCTRAPHVYEPPVDLLNVYDTNSNRYGDDDQILGWGSSRKIPKRY